MLSKKSFEGYERNFLKPLMSFMCGDVRDHIARQKNDYGPSQQHHRVSQRRSGPKITICEIFDAVRFPTFSTASTQLGLPTLTHSIAAVAGPGKCPLQPTAKC
jgi:hypothetical protein